MRSLTRRCASSALARFTTFTLLCTACSSEKSGGKSVTSEQTARDGGSGGAEATGGAQGTGSFASTGGATSGGGNGGAASDGGSGNGSGTGGASSGGTGGASSSGGASTGGAAAMWNPAPGSKFFIGANFWNIDWEGSGNYFDGSVDFATTTNPWRADLLSEIAPYGVLRFMDWNAINDPDTSSNTWDTRKSRTANQSEPVAFEWQIDLCNRTKKDYWLNVPHLADATYWQGLATLVRDTLDPDLRVYLEWSNEVWNGAFPQKQYATSQAQSLGLPGSDGSAAYYVYAAVRAFEAFESVFGKGNPRLVKVLAGQAAWTGPCEAHTAALASSQINPNGTQPDVYAIAPYLFGTSISELSGAMPTVTQWVQSAKVCADSLGVPLIAYEGGNDSYAAGGGCQTLQHDAAMYDVYTSYLNAISSAGLSGPFVQYTHTGACWGLKQYTGEATDAAPKYRSVVDWLSSH